MIYVVETDDTNQIPDVVYKDPVKELGFAKIDHIITLDRELSDGAYRTYALLIFHAQQKGLSWVGVDTMAELRGVSEATISSHLSELSDMGLISRKRRMGRSSLTYIEDLPEKYPLMAGVILEARKDKNIKKTLGKSSRKLDVSPQENLMREEEQYKKNNTNSSVSAKPAETAANKPTIVPKSIIDTDDTDKPARKKWEPRTEWARYLAANARYGRSYWEGFASSKERIEWETLEGTRGDKFKSAIDWAIEKRIRKSLIAERVMKAVENKEAGKKEYVYEVSM